MRLLEWLLHQVLDEPVPPTEHGFRTLAQRMPQAHLVGRVEPIQRPAVVRDHATLEPDTGFMPLARGELPDESARERADQRVVEVARAPCGVVPALLFKVQVLDAVALRGQHFLDVFGRLL